MTHNHPVYNMFVATCNGFYLVISFKEAITTNSINNYLFIKKKLKLVPPLGESPAPPQQFQKIHYGINVGGIVFSETLRECVRDETRGKTGLNLTYKYSKKIL